MTNDIPVATEWRELIAGPAMIEASSGSFLIRWSDTKPTADVTTGHRVAQGGAGISYPGRSTAWALSGPTGATAIVTGMG